MFQVSSGDSTVIVLFVIHRFLGIEVGKGMHAPLQICSIFSLLI